MMEVQSAPQQTRAKQLIKKDDEYSKLLEVLEANTNWPTKEIYPVPILFGSVVEASSAYIILTTHTRKGFSSLGFTGTSHILLQVPKRSVREPICFPSPSIRNQIYIFHLALWKRWKYFLFSRIQSHFFLSPVRLLPPAPPLLPLSCQPSCECDTGAWWFRYELTKPKTHHLQTGNGDTGRLWFLHKSEKVSDKHNSPDFQFLRISPTIRLLSIFNF